METNNQPVSNSALLDFFATALQEMYWAETNLVSVLNTMSQSASTVELQEAFRVHAEQTGEHVRRLDQVFALMGLEPAAEPCIGLQGLFDEGWQVIDESEAGSAQRDVALIIAAQKVEHYEIACYGSLVTLAKTMRQREIADILVMTLEEEKETDALLTTIAESGINAEASQEPVSAL